MGATAPKRRTSPSRPLGEHPADGKAVTQGKGRYGPYVKHAGLFASIPKDMDPEQVTLEQAVELLAAQAEKKGKGKAKGKSKPKTKAKAKTAGKTTARGTKSKGRSATKAKPAEKAGAAS